jgi:hypothetical protein
LKLGVHRGEKARDPDRVAALRPRRRAAVVEAAVVLERPALEPDAAQPPLLAAMTPSGVGGVENFGFQSNGPIHPHLGNNPTN